MISKEDAEKKLLQMFYDVKLDAYFNLNPTNANIEFEKSEDPEYLDHAYGIEDNVLQIGMWASSLDLGIPYYAVIMAHDSAKHWRDDPLAKKMKLYTLSHLFIPIITMILGFYLKFQAFFGAIAINVIGSGVLIYFIWLKKNWKKRVETRFKDLFQKTGIRLVQAEIKKYSKSCFPEKIFLGILQGITLFLLLLSWLFTLIEVV